MLELAGSGPSVSSCTAGRYGGWWLSGAAGAMALREVGGSVEVQCMRVLMVLGILRAKACPVLLAGGVDVYGHRLTYLEV